MYGSEGSDSEVWREPLSGKDLPDTVAASPSASASPSAGGSSTGGPAASASPGSGTGDAQNKVLGIAVLAAMGGIGVWARRARQRSRSGGGGHRRG